MAAYRKILALIDVSPNGEKVVRRALHMARLYNATLGVATVVDYTPGYESGHAPFLTPRQARQALSTDFKGRLAALLERAGAKGVEQIVAVGPLRPSVRDLLQSWEPELVVVGSHEAYGLAQAQALEKDERRTLPFDVLVVQMDRPRGFAGRLVRALAAAF